MAQCHENKSAVPVAHNHKTILLMGLPNVGKSAIFSRYTNMHVTVSNYPGTTVEYVNGFMTIDETRYVLKDAPGVYNIKQGIDAAEQVAIDMLNEQPDAVLFVLDALNLESSLFLLMQVLEYKIPTVVALNRNDLSQSRGITIDERIIANRLNVDVVPTVALEGKSLDTLKTTLKNRIDNPHANFLLQEGDEARWEDVERIVKRAVKRPVDPNDPNEKYAFLIRPFPGLLIALLMLGLAFALVIGLGMGLRQFVLLPLLREGLFPFIEQSVTSFITNETLKNVLIGDYGFLIKGIEWPFALVLPYVISFYAMLSILEDTGYLPRLAVLLDGVFKKIGLPGSSIIPLLLGYGCGIPAIMATRSLPSKKARLSLAVMISLAVPCVSQTGAFIALLSERSLLALVFVFAFSIIALMLTGFVMDKINKEKAPFSLYELPQLLMPKPRILGKKIAMRIKHYIKDGATPMIIAIFFTAFLYEFGVLQVIGEGLSPVVSGWLRLPEEASTPLLLGVIRRELAVLPLFDMTLTTLQFITAAIVALLYVPCIAMIATLTKEFNGRVAVGVFIFTTVAAIGIGGLIARIGAWLLIAFA